MKSTWDLSADDTVAVTTERGPWESDDDFLARHEASVRDSIDDAVAPEDLDTLIEDHFLDLTADLPIQGDEEEKEITLPP